MRRLSAALCAVAIVLAGGAPTALANNHTLKRCRHHHGRHYCHKHGFHHTRIRWNHGVASWYDDAGPTASGWHSTYGVANLAYSFGTKVYICYHGCVLATVDDRGPYVSGREWDLGASTARAMGFSGVETVRWRLAR